MKYLLIFALLASACKFHLPKGSIELKNVQATYLRMIPVEIKVEGKTRFAAVVCFDETKHRRAGTVLLNPAGEQMVFKGHMEIWNYLAAGGYRYSGDIKLDKYQWTVWEKKIQ